MKIEDKTTTLPPTEKPRPGDVICIKWSDSTKWYIVLTASACQIDSLWLQQNEIPLANLPDGRLTKVHWPPIDSVHKINGKFVVDSKQLIIGT